MSSSAFDASSLSEDASSQAVERAPGERVLCHGTLIVYIRRAEQLGRSHLLPEHENKEHSKDKTAAQRAGNTIEKGLRFVGKKALNAARTTNHVCPIPGIRAAGPTRCGSYALRHRDSGQCTEVCCSEFFENSIDKPRSTLIRVHQAGQLMTYDAQCGHTCALTLCVHSALQAAQKVVSKELGAFVEVEIAGDVVIKTNAKYNSRQRPIWNEIFHVHVCHELESITFRVRTCFPSTAPPFSTARMFVCRVPLRHGANLCSMNHNI